MIVVFIRKKISFSMHVKNLMIITEQIDRFVYIDRCRNEIKSIVGKLAEGKNRNKVKKTLLI